MGWLKKLPRIIRPPRKVRAAIEKIKPRTLLPAAGFLIPGLGPAATLAISKLNFVRGTRADIIKQAFNPGGKKGKPDVYTLPPSNKTSVSASSLITSTTPESNIPIRDNKMYVIGAIVGLVLLMFILKKR